MTAATTPGVYFESRPPAPPAVLPRMDIGGFVGFASSGPVSVPVAIEDPGRFREIFGDDIDLAWDPAEGRLSQGYLGAAVRSFFRNGGRRCWVVRVAGPAQPAQFLLPGMLTWTATSGFRGAAATARSAGSWSDRLRVNAEATEQAIVAAAAQPGDLLRFRFAASSVTGFAAAGSALPGGALWFRPLDVSEALPAVTLASWLGPGNPVALAMASAAWQNGELAMQLNAAPPGIAAGTWLRLTTATGALFAVLEEVTGLSLRTTRAWWPLDAATAAGLTAGQTAQTSVIEVDLLTEIVDGDRGQLSDLGLAPTGPRFIGNLPDDVAVFRDGAPADSPRFALACNSDAWFIPLAVSDPADDRFVQVSFPSTLSRLDRDGITAFDAGLFLDPNMVSYGASTLLDAAFHLQYQVQPPVNLTGLHALLPVDEISLVAMPDAVQRGWAAAPPSDVMPDAPVLSPVILSGDTALLVWSGVPLVDSYDIQASEDPVFGTLLWRHSVTDAHDQDSTPDPVCGADRYYRVRALGAWGVTPWSNTEAAPRGRGTYEECGRQLPAAPVLSTVAGDPDRTTFQWTSAGPGPFALMVSDDPAFETSTLLYSGTETAFTFWKQPGADEYFRLRAAGPWSNTIAIRPQRDPGVETVAAARDGQEPDSSLARLEQLQASLLIFCAARSDVFAVLSLPGHFRERSTRQMRDRLVASPRLAGDDRTLSFGALYHPWTVTQQESLRPIPPDGAAAGIMAARALAGGAWLAPANRTLAGALALEPANLDPSLRYGDRLNIVEDAPEGFLVMNSDTLSADTDYRTIGTRRLTILLRRLALREGNRLVFEPNDPRLARRITRQFEEFMSFLYARGAFIGATHDQAYRVLVTSSPQDIDAGRLIVELRFAPADPLAFLTVRMVEAGGAWVVMEGN